MRLVMSYRPMPIGAQLVFPYCEGKLCVADMISVLFIL